MADNEPVLALYDFRSKQEFIYRTNRMREITGASELIAGMYAKFVDALGGSLIDDWESAASDDNDLSLGESDGVVVYEGGGNLCILFKDREAYRRANKRFSRIVLDTAYSLNLVSACAPWTGDFESSRRAVYAELDRKKRIGAAEVPCNVMPYSQVDRVTFQPVFEKKGDGELSRESSMKLRAYGEKAKEDSEWAMHGRFIDDIAAEKGADSLIAVMYSDGNSIGERLKTRGNTVVGMREFSKEVHNALVVNTERAIKGELEWLARQPDCERLGGYRIIIDHGDEITLICNAHAAPFALDAYFRSLGESSYHACAGVAFCHSHDPFSEVYRIAEACCESGKKRNRTAMKRGGTQGDASYIDFHFCRSGITGSLEQIRASQEAEYTARPYRVGGDYNAFVEVGCCLSRSRLTRADIKELNRSIMRGDSWYQVEIERLRAKDASALKAIEDSLCCNYEGQAERGLDMKSILFDVSSMWDVYDKWFEFGAGR